MLRCYTSRVENGHTVPSVETLEKYARALEIPLYQLFHDGKSPTRKLDLRAVRRDDDFGGMKRKERRELRLFAKALSRMSERNRKMLFAAARDMAKRSKPDRF